MQLITDLNCLHQLNLPLETHHQLFEALVTVPFGSLEEALKFWNVHSTSLVVAESKDNPDSLLATYPQLHHLLTYPEFVTRLSNGWFLALSVTTDDGSGSYLLFPEGVDDDLDQLIADHC